jgi:hypothetical protein
MDDARVEAGNPEATPSSSSRIRRLAAFVLIGGLGR